MHDERDETIERVRASLKPLPAMDPRAIARVLAAVQGREPKPIPRWREFIEWMRIPSMSMAGAGVLALGALTLGFIVRGVVGSPESSTVSSTVTETAAAVAALPASRTEREAVVSVQFVFESASAQTVAVVGDFNDWKIDQAPMQRFGNGAWTVSLPIRPGRHVYSFVIDGTLWRADPRAPKASDSDFGKPGSVIVVNTP